MIPSTSSQIQLLYTLCSQQTIECSFVQSTIARDRGGAAQCRVIRRKHYTVHFASERLDVYKQAQLDDPVCAQVREYCTKQWPAKKFISDEVLPYWTEHDSLTVCKNLLMSNNRIVVPKSLQQETLALKKAHIGHQEIERW